MRYAFKSRSSFSRVLGCPGLGEVGVLGSGDGEWLVPVSKIPPFTFRHLVISGVSSCLNILTHAKCNYFSSTSSFLGGLKGLLQGQNELMHVNNLTLPSITCVS